MTFAIQTRNLFKTYGKILALNDLSFTVKRGRIHGLLGPNGAGKTTLIKILSGLLLPDKGELSVEEKLGVLPENPPLYPHMKVRDYLRFTGELVGLSSKELERNVDEFIFKCKLASFSYRLIANLSKGQRQRVAIAQAMMGHPLLLILDEPLAGLDPESLFEMRSLIKSIVHEEEEKTVLISGHQLYEIEQLCSEVSIISYGSLQASGTLDEVKALASGLNETFLIELEGDAMRLGEKLMKDYPIDAVKTSFLKETKTWKLELTLKKGMGIRKDLIKFLVESGFSLLRFEKHDMDLEHAYSKLREQSRVSEDAGLAASESTRTDVMKERSWDL